MWAFMYIRCSFNFIILYKIIWIGLVLICVIFLCRSLKYLIKISYSIQDYPNDAGVLVFETLCLGRSKTLSYVWKIYHKNERHLCLVAHSFTKISQIMCLINTHILIYLHARCNCKLWKALSFYCVFGYFRS